MNNLNLLDFYKDSAHTFMTLYGQFPRKTDIYVEDMIGTEQTDEFGLRSKRHEASFGALLWLAEEGYIRYNSTIRQEAIDQAILTSKGLLVLGQIASSCQYDSEQLDSNGQTRLLEPQPVIEHIRSALKSQSSTQLSQVMQHVFKR